MSKTPFFINKVKFHQFSVLQDISATFLSQDRQSSREDLRCLFIYSSLIRMVQTPKWRSGNVITETNLVTNHKKKALQRHNGSNSTHVRRGKKKRQIFIFIPKTQYHYSALHAMVSWQTYLWESVWMAVFKSKMMMTWNCSGLWFWWWEKENNVGSWSKSKKFKK